MVLTPLCDILSSVLRQFKMESGREGFLRGVCVPLIDAMAWGEGGEEGVVSLSAFWRIDPESVALKDLMLEKVGGGLIR